MTIQWSTAVRNARLNAIPSAVGPSAILRLYSGAEPSSCTAALSGNTLLVEFDLAANWAAAASSGSMSLAYLPLSAIAVGAGNASFYRMFASDGVTCHEQGSVTQTGGGGDMILDNVNLAVGQNVQITAFSKTEPGA